ncbi:sensor histidine kinase [Rhodoplanes sp. Z2-YC6860]|uniref:sensor histidine kinase n=1 Tax=Rhodoplanes sp. Z2-YC6860 TaxID=674703 RepID=UPI00078CF7A6|nr:ATP-binding protein [Rhodoplanes sp. Z2-YC6860]AMN44375.1 integral membrane sensor signal transduction histidine kinase [Rhodoplanes sp. Z2-YC6860]
MSRTLSKSWLLGLALWLAALGAFALVTIVTSRQRLADELDVTGQTLHRLISQRVAQHDAHLTSLIALSSGNEPVPAGTARQVMESISRFYPRIVWIALIALESDANAPKPAGRATTARTIVAVPDAGGIDLAPLAADIAGQQRGRPSIYSIGGARYLLAKRAPGASNVAVVLLIDAAQLVEPEERPAFADLKLSLGGRPLVEQPADTALVSGASWLSPLHFEKVIDGDGQRLLLELDRALPLGTLIPVKQFLGFAVAAALLCLALVFGLRQRAAIARSQEAAREAKERLIIQERETRLAHASRVNSMGELASGIAHELTQPLTALLSRSEAASRLAQVDKPNLPLISETLALNVREAKRAGEILKRMRDYASNKTPQRTPQDLNMIVTETVALVRADLEQRGIKLSLKLAEPAPHAMVDAIETQQVLHNLIRNAAEAAGNGGLITIETQAVGGEARFVVSDNGPGLSAALLPKLFTPFVTTKADGMGLGLSLCATLVERVDGRIEADNLPAGGARFTVSLPLLENQSQAAQ